LDLSAQVDFIVLEIAFSESFSFLVEGAFGLVESRFLARQHPAGKVEVDVH
jgi:hypothetical protein